MVGFNRKTAQGAIARHLRSITALCMFAAPLAAFSSGCDAGGAPGEKENVAEANQALKACVTLPATGDAMVTLRPKAQTWGSHPALRVGGNDESLVKFDLSSIPAEASVDSATLKLYASSVNGTNPVKIHAADNAWSESTVSYEGFNQQFETTVSAILDPNVATTYKTADVKGLVNRWRSGAKANSGILLTRDGNDKAQFTSRDGSAGFGPTLTVCYTLIEDLCAAGPCAHGACTNGDPTYTCACDPGWTGTNCDLNIDECAGNPCLNGSTCTDGVNSYSCACAPGYTGTNCETDIDECAADPCQHGICTDQINAYSCACDPGFAGTNCEIDIDECAGNPCFNGSTCTDHVNGYTCACTPGYTGTNCEIDIDECAGTPCQNGDCVDGVNAYTCACLPGFTGTNCEINIDECAGDPCLNGGACSDGVFSYTCDCAAGYTGTNCEVDIDDCAATPCQNDGLCVDGVNSYTCQCAPGWTGTNCEEPVASACPCEPEFTMVKESVLALPAVDQCSLDPSAAFISNSSSSGAFGFGAASAASNGTNACVAVDSNAGIISFHEGITDAELAACLALMPATCPPINPCASGVCQNGSLCEPSADYLSYTCTCTPGWTGTNCDVNIDECADAPCQNGGTCVDGMNSYTCECQSGYTGTNCETPPAPQFYDCEANNPCTEENMALSLFRFPTSNPSQFVVCTSLGPWGPCSIETCPDDLVWNDIMQSCFVFP